MSWLNNEYNSSWMKHVQKYAKKHGITSMKIALKSAAPSYCVKAKRRKLCTAHQSKNECNMYPVECIWYSKDGCKGRQKTRSSKHKKNNKTKHKKNNKKGKTSSVMSFIGLSGGAMSEYSRQTSTKYTTRPSPPFKATPYCGLTKIGNDGEWYFSKPTSKGGCRWVKVNMDSAGKKKTTKKTRVKVKREITPKKRTTTPKKRTTTKKTKKTTSKRVKSVNLDKSKQTSEKYISRKSPPYHASAWCGSKKRGNDGNWYFSKLMPNGSCRWVKY